MTKTKYTYHSERIASEWDAYCDIMTPEAEALARQLKPAMDALWTHLKHSTDENSEPFNELWPWPSNIDHWTDLKILLAAGLVDKEETP